MLNGIESFLGSAAYAIPAFLFIITAVVFFHELGHFSVARFFGVRIETFSIGFGPAIVSWRDRKNTLWKISWFPLGGFVKFFGDADGASTPDREAAAKMSPEDRAVAFPFKPLWQRALIVLAGPVANFILALVILTGFYWVDGRLITPPVVSWVQPGSPAQAAGIKIGDKFLEADGEKIESYEQLIQIVSLSAGETLPFKLQRGSQVIDISATPRLVETVGPFNNKVKVGQIGIKDLAKSYRVPLGPFQAVGQAVNEIEEIMGSSFRARGQILQGNTSQLSGPVGILKISGQVARVSLIALIQLVALLSVSIGLVNLFPIPLLDGGHLLYYAFEGVLGRPLGERAQDVGFRLGLAVVAGIFLLVTWNDLLNLF
ncbi:MAG TPA: RIP metalloprotease RseP [Rhizomicrobium sp.]|jgi:regulator of sigma E protease|nr:RIP metalloprotease RseP [Rhizomicrobium sp.]